MSNLKITITVFASANCPVCPDDINMDFYICILDKLTSEFSIKLDWAEYFDFYHICSQYISDPYTAYSKFKLTISTIWTIFDNSFSKSNKLIELQAETSIKSNSIIDLWKNYSNYFNFQMMAARILSFFSSTYCCESTFFALQNINNKITK